MKIRKVIRKEVQHDDDGVSVAGGLNAVIAANVNESDSKTHISSRQRIVQRSGETVVESEQTDGGQDEFDKEEGRRD